MNSIVTLNGEWDILFDTEDLGISNRWYATYPSATQKIQVPSVWEKCFDKFSPSQDAAYYFKRFQVDKNEVAKRVFLRFERISMHATFWLNGKYLGQHFGAYSPCIIDASKAILLGEENVLCVRVASMSSTSTRIDRGRESAEGAEDRFVRPTEMPVGLPWSEYPFGGIYGNVDLILGGTAFISGVQLEPDMDEDRLAVDVSFNNPRGFSSRLRILIQNPAGGVSEMIKDLKLEKENASSRFVLKFRDGKKNRETWSPENPNVYKIELQLESKAAKGKAAPEHSFSVVRSFGFRKFDCIKGDFFLNDLIVKIQGVTYTQHSSEGGLWSSDKKKLRNDLWAIKNAGFNTVRSNGAPLTNAALDICDEIGLMVFQELPIYTMRSTPEGLEEVKKLIGEIVMEQKHHPSIAAWILGSENGPLVLENGNKLLKTVDEFDKCRPVISNLNCVFLSNEEEFHKDTGKLMGVTNDKIFLYSSQRMHLRMSPNAILTDFLAHYCDKDRLDDEDALTPPDTTLGDSQFQDEYANFVSETNGKILVTLKNHTFLPNSPTDIKGPRSAKNSKAVKQLYKQIDAFLSKDISIWKNFAEFNADAKRLSLQSKLSQINAIQSDPLVSGFMLDQWADFGTDLCGLVDENRKSKGLESFMKSATIPTRLLVTGLEPVSAPQAEISFQLALLNQARLENVDVKISIVDANGKTVSETSQKAVGQTSLTQLGTFTTKAPREPGDYSLVLSLWVLDENISTTSERILVLDDVDVQSAMSQVCFLDNMAETTSDAMAALAGSEKIIFTANLNSWNEEVLSKIVELTRDSGKTLFLSDLSREDIEAFNSSHYFTETIDAHFSTGANGLSIHYLVKNSPLLSEFAGHTVLDELSSSVLPSVSLNELPNATVLARSVSINQGELRTGVDLQIIPFGKGRIVFNQLNLVEGLETNPLADRVFTKLVQMLTK